METSDKLNVKAQVKFTDTFDAIKEYFTQTSASFFDGSEEPLNFVVKLIH